MATVRLIWVNPTEGSEIRIFRSNTSFGEQNLPPVLATIPASSQLYDDINVAGSGTFYYAVGIVQGGSVSVSFASVVVDAGISVVPIGVNTGGEDGDATGWTLTDMTVVPSASRSGSDPITPYFGSFMFLPGQVANCSGVQDIDVTLYSSEIDADQVEIDFLGAVVSDFTDDDSGQFTIDFIDAQSAIISTLSGAVLSPVSGDANWTEDTLAGAVPLGTRTIRLSMIGQRDFGSNLSVAFDISYLNLIVDTTIKWANVSFVEHDQVSPSWAGSTGRTSIAPAEFLINGDQIRLTAQAWDANGCAIDQVWIGKKGAATYDFDGAPTQVLWNGTPAFILGVGEEIVSDPISIAYDASADQGLVIAWQVDAAAAEDNIGAKGTKLNFQSASKGGADASTEIATSYSAVVSDAYLISAIEFEQNIIPAGFWSEQQTVVQNQSSNAWAGFTGRIAVNGTEFDRRASRIRITVQALAGESMIADDFFVGLKTGSFGYDAAPTRITWGGANSVTVAAAQQAVSDEIDFEYDPNVNDGLVFAFYKGAGATGENYAAEQTRSGWETYSKSGNFTEELPGTGFTAGNRDAVAIVLIEFFTETGVESQWVGALS